MYTILDFDSDKRQPKKIVQFFQNIHFPKSKFTTMKFNLKKKFSKKNENSDVRVTRVRIMAERPRIRSHPVEQPSNEIKHTVEQTPVDITKNAQPPSPTDVREQFQLDANIVDAEEKEADSIADWNLNYGGMGCTSSPRDNNCNGNVSGESKHSETTKRWKELRKIINLKIETMHGKYFGDIHEFALSLEQNQNEIDQAMRKIDKENSAADPLSWLWVSENAQGEYDNPLMTCADMTALVRASQDACGEESDVIATEPNPSSA